MLTCPPDAGQSNAVNKSAEAIQAQVADVDQVLMALQNVKAKRKLEVMESEGSNSERAEGMEALGRCEAADKKPKSDEHEFKDPHNKCSCSCHRITCGTCKKFFVKVTVNI